MPNKRYKKWFILKYVNSPKILSCDDGVTFDLNFYRSFPINVDCIECSEETKERGVKQYPILDLCGGGNMRQAICPTCYKKFSPTNQQKQQKRSRGGAMTYCSKECYRNRG